MTSFKKYKQWLQLKPNEQIEYLLQAKNVEKHDAYSSIFFLSAKQLELNALCLGLQPSLPKFTPCFVMKCYIVPLWSGGEDYCKLFIWLVSILESWLETRIHRLSWFWFCKPSH